MLGTSEVSAVKDFFFLSLISQLRPCVTGRHRLAKTLSPYIRIPPPILCFEMSLVTSSHQVPLGEVLVALVVTSASPSSSPRALLQARPIQPPTTPKLFFYCKIGRVVSLSICHRNPFCCFECMGVHGKDR